MKSERLGKNIALITAATLILAACSKNEEPVERVDGPSQVEQSSGSTGEPTQPTTPSLTEEQLDAQEWGGESQDGIIHYAGADRIFFAYDSSELSAHARATLDKQANWLMHYPRVRVTIEGHCDERGTREYNLALGDRRATAVKNYLIARGVPASRLKTISYGKERPAVAGDFSQNRRGVLVVQ